MISTSPDPTGPSPDAPAVPAPAGLAGDGAFGLEIDPNIDLDLELVARLRVAIARLGRQLRQQAGELSPTLQSMLASIAIHGPLSLSELAAIEQVAPPTVTKVLSKLDERNLIVRERGPEDRRVTLVSLSDEGLARFNESRTRRTAWLVRRLGELGIDDDARLVETVDLLEALAQPTDEPSRPGGRRSPS